MTTGVMNKPQTGDPVRTALLLAAGTGSRLQPLTHDVPKCLTEVNDVPILEQQVRCLEQCGFERLVLVLGHLENRIRDFFQRRSSSLRIEYITNPLYRTTNNIYSLWIARELVQEPFLLLESDLFFDSALLGPMLQADSIAVSTIRPWMTGSTVELDPSRRVVSMHVGAGSIPGKSSLKTVNIYSLSATTWQAFTERLNSHIMAGQVSDYYEVVFSELIAEGVITLRSVFFDHKRWYEIDTPADLLAAERIFLPSMQALRSRARPW